MNDDEMLEFLRWNADQCVVNYEGERVWLKAVFDEQGKQMGITDCCPAEDPCAYHEALLRAKGVG